MGISKANQPAEDEGGESTYVSIRADRKWYLAGVPDARVAVTGTASTISDVVQQICWLGAAQNRPIVCMFVQTTE
ncbi:hypothetical protein M7I_0053 [Glarea lozoyensis 74030]|uniref:Uncharacterized protein n=1 Tax=Glarea lozoyensis (strain ATCC 74030 / MF5533) TaxID=1104152 RepID=H0ECB9_GLAL7|nr:hypothetical protein M7I_0053 [Glarea lozoyensis 74030]